MYFVISSLELLAPVKTCFVAWSRSIAVLVLASSETQCHQFSFGLKGSLFPMTL